LFEWKKISVQGTVVMRLTGVYDLPEQRKDLMLSIYLENLLKMRYTAYTVLSKTLRGTTELKENHNSPKYKARSWINI
jgi:hypothetical protein